VKNCLLVLFIIFYLPCSALMAEDNKVLCLYNNEGVEGGELIIDWGFSALIYYNDQLILFDSGASSEILEHNCDKLGVDLSDVDIAVLSHNHRDHITGLNYLLEVNPAVKLYLPDDSALGGESSEENEEWNSKYRVNYRFQDADVRFVKQNIQIAPGVALIPTVAASIGVYLNDPKDEQNIRYWGLPEVSLAVKSNDDKWILLDGCSHSGVAEIVKNSNEYLKTNVDGVIGGFHMLRYSNDQASEIAKQMKEILKVNWVAPTHCTGDIAKQMFKEQYKNDLKNFDVGSIIEF
jgi:7,8-dihydropterin-6-yl-methyl-4-(beta-D-ribofuranosyl)aminobenzene 5'-phosphate synthase